MPRYSRSSAVTPPRGAASAAQPVYASANIIQPREGTDYRLSQHDFKTFLCNAPSNGAEAKFMGNYLVNVRHIKRIAVVSDHSSFAKGLGDAVEKAIKANGGNVLTRA